MALLTAPNAAAVEAVCRRLLSSFAAAIQPAHSLAYERERAIADGLREQRARLASSLLQPGLFDRRAEHRAAAQNATLDAALDRCVRRLVEIEQHAAVAADPRLVLGLLRR